MTAILSALLIVSGFVGLALFVVFTIETRINRAQAAGFDAGYNAGYKTAYRLATVDCLAKKPHTEEIDRIRSDWWARGYGDAQSDLLAAMKKDIPAYHEFLDTVNGKKSHQ